MSIAGEYQCLCISGDLSDLDMVTLKVKVTQLYNPLQRIGHSDYGWIEEWIKSQMGGKDRWIDKD